MRGWWPLYRTSVGLGLRYLSRHGYLREAVIRVIVPLEPARYLELPEALRELRAERGQRVLDLASPKLLAVTLARRGVEVVSVDQHSPEIEVWRKLTERERGLSFQVADGRALELEDASFDHAYSLSVLEHIPRPGDEEALRELARVVRPGGRVVITLPFAEQARDEYREAPIYEHRGEAGGRYFFQRWYDDAGLEALAAAAAPELELAGKRLVRLRPNWNRAYTRTFPLLIPIVPLSGLLAREQEGAGGDIVRVTFTRR